FASGWFRTCFASTWQHAFLEREFSLECLTRGSVGLVFVRGRDRSSWRHQLALATVRIGKSVAFSSGALPRHDAFDQDAQKQISPCDACAALLHVRRHFLGRLSQSVFV